MSREVHIEDGDVEPRATDRHLGRWPVRRAAVLFVVGLGVGSCANPDHRAAGEDHAARSPDGGSTAVGSRVAEPNPDEMPRGRVVLRESCSWLSGNPTLAWFESASAELLEHAGTLQGTVEFPSEIDPDTGAPRPARFLVEGDRRELRIGTTTHDLAERADLPEGLLAWEHLVFSGVGLYRAPAADGVEAVLDLLVPRESCVESPVRAGARRVSRLDVAALPQHRAAIDDRLSVLLDPETGDVLALEVGLRDALASELPVSVAPRGRIHYARVEGGEPTVVVIEYADETGVRVLEDRRYGAARAYGPWRSWWMERAAAPR